MCHPFLMSNDPTEKPESEVAVVLMNEEGTIVDAQPNCGALLGWTREELVGNDIGLLLKTGRDLVMDHLLQISDRETENTGNTSLAVKVLAKRKNQTQFQARVSVRRFAQLGCWTAAFYSHVSHLESEAPPTVSPEEIDLATRALKEGGIHKVEKKSPRNEDGTRPASGKSTMNPDTSLWRSARLLIRSKKDQPTHTPPPQEEPDFQQTEEIQPEPPVLAELEPAPAIVQEEVYAEEPPQFEEPVVPIEVQHEVTPEEVQEIIPVVQETDAPAVQPAEEPERFVEPDSAALTEATRELARLRSELERERGLRTRAEQRVASLNTQVQTLHLQVNETLEAESTNSTRIAELENELEVAQHLVAQERAQFEKESMERGAAEEQLQILKELNTQLEASMASFEEANRALEQEKGELEGRLQATQAALKESELAREGDITKRQEMELQLAAARREQQEVEARSREEVSKAQSDLRASELQCKRLEADLLRTRASAVEEHRQANRKAEEFRSRLRDPVTNLNQTACQLLQTGLPDEQKEMMELMLRDVMSVENSLRERISAPPAEAPEAAN